MGLGEQANRREEGNRLGERSLVSKDLGLSSQVILLKKMISYIQM